MKTTFQPMHTYLTGDDKEFGRTFRFRGIGYLEKCYEQRKWSKVKAIPFFFFFFKMRPVVNGG